MFAKNSLELKMSYITLGDGDFSYSLDLAQYLFTNGSCTIETNEMTLSQNVKHKVSKENDNRKSASDKNNETQPSNSNQANIHLVATGIDTYDEIHVKYRDISSILAKLKKINEKWNKSEKKVDYTQSCATEPTLKKQKHCNNKSSYPSSIESFCGDETNLISKMNGAKEKNPININKSPKKTYQVKISIHHSINAIIEDADTRNPLCSFDHVIFNHPHLGTEDAQLHKRFLSHFFHSVFHHWLRPSGGILHLTLVSMNTYAFALTLLQLLIVNSMIPFKSLKMFVYQINQIKSNIKGCWTI